MTQQQGGCKWETADVLIFGGSFHCCSESILGWFLLGWLIAPVKWSNAGLQDLDPALKQAYVVTAAEAFAQTQDSGKVIERLQGMGSQADVAAIAVGSGRGCRGVW